MVSYMYVSEKGENSRKEKRMIKKKILPLLLAMMMTVGLVAGCGKSESDSETQGSKKEEASYKDTIVYSLDSSPTGKFISVLGLSDYDSSIVDVIYASLLAPNASGELSPYLAESYDVSEDGTTYTFKIHDNAVWTDGEAVTAEDVAFTFTLLAEPDNGSIYEEGVAKLKGVSEYQAGSADAVEGINVIDDHTIEFTFEEPYAKGLSILGEVGIMPEHIWKGIKFADLEKQSAEMRETPVVCGPYQVVKFVADEYVQLEANKDFFLGEPATKNFYFKVINADSISAELTSGEVDIAAVTNLKNDEIAELEKQGFKMNYFSYDLVQCLRFNLEKGYGKDFRLALAYAIDRQSFVDDLMEGRGSVANVMISAGSWAYPKDVDGVSQDFDKAREYLEKAGYKDVDNDGYVEDPNGAPFALNLAYPQGLTVREQSAVVIQENLKQIGVKVELNIYDFPTLMTVMSEGKYDVMLMGHGVDSTDPDISSYLDSLGYSDKVKELAAEALKTTDQNERKELYKEIAVDQQAEANVITLYCQEKVYAYPETMINYEAGTFNNFYNVHKWAIAE